MAWGSGISHVMAPAALSSSVVEEESETLLHHGTNDETDHQQRSISGAGTLSSSSLPRLGVGSSRSLVAGFKAQRPRRLPDLRWDRAVVSGNGRPAYASNSGTVPRVCSLETVAKCLRCRGDAGRLDLEAGTQPQRGVIQSTYSFPVDDWKTVVRRKVARWTMMFRKTQTEQEGLEKAVAKELLKLLGNDAWVTRVAPHDVSPVSDNMPMEPIASPPPSSAWTADDQGGEGSHGSSTAGFVEGRHCREASKCSPSHSQHVTRRGNLDTTFKAHNEPWGHREGEDGRGHADSSLLFSGLSSLFSSSFASFFSSFSQLPLPQQQEQQQHQERTLWITCCCVVHVFALSLQRLLSEVGHALRGGAMRYRGLTGSQPTRHEEEGQEQAAASLLRHLRTRLALSEDVLVLGYLYAGRFCQKGGHAERVFQALGLKRDWGPVAVAGLLLASKVWEDVHPWNVDFWACVATHSGAKGGLEDMGPEKYLCLELGFLQALSYRLHITQAEYEMRLKELLLTDEASADSVCLDVSLGEERNTVPTSVATAAAAGAKSPRCTAMTWDSGRTRGDSQCSGEENEEAGEDECKSLLPASHIHGEGQVSIRGVTTRGRRALGPPGPMLAPTCLVFPLRALDFPLLDPRPLPGKEADDDIIRGGVPFLTPKPCKRLPKPCSYEDDDDSDDGNHNDEDIDARIRSWANENPRLDPRNPFVGYYRHARPTASFAFGRRSPGFGPSTSPMSSVRGAAFFGDGVTDEKDEPIETVQIRTSGLEGEGASLRVTGALGSRLAQEMRKYAEAANNDDDDDAIDESMEEITGVGEWSLTPSVVAVATAGPRQRRRRRQVPTSSACLALSGPAGRELAYELKRELREHIFSRSSRRIVSSKKTPQPPPAAQKLE